MTRASRFFGIAISVLSLAHSTPKAYAAEAFVTFDTSFRAASQGLTASVLTARLLPEQILPAALVPEALLPEKPAGLALLPAYSSVEQAAALVGAETQQQARNHAWRHRWLLSLGPLVASQSLDAASSWGLRELNPVLAGPDGRFGTKATAIKFGVIGGLTGAEYLLVKRFPASAKFFTAVNYTMAGITSGLAVHNYQLPGR